MTEQTQVGLFDRTLGRISRAFRDVAGSARVAWTGTYRPDLPDEDAARLARQIARCLEGRGGEISMRGRAAELGRIYLSLGPGGRHRFLEILARHHGIDREALAAAAERWQAAGGEAELAAAEAELRTLLEPPAIQLLRQFNSLPEGVKFLVDLRADLLPLTGSDPALAALSDQLRALLASWFDIGFLDLRQITWNAPAALLEKLMLYEAVHAIRSWSDLKDRLDSDRRCFAFFHPRMPDEPLIFVEVALVDGMAGSVQVLLDEAQPAYDPARADSAIFYSISNCQKGLAGVSFGNFLIKRVVDVLARDLPKLAVFATLSPIPGFRTWLQRRLDADDPSVLTAAERTELAAAAGVEEAGPAVLAAVLDRPDWPQDATLAAVLKAPLLRLCAEYLLQARQGKRARDRVAHFHLSNGARVERLNWLADTSPNGLRQSAGIMVNYRYKLDMIEANHEAYSGEGEIVAHQSVRRLLRA